MLTIGLRQLLGGARRGRPGTAGFGAALVILGWMRGRRNKDDRLVYSRRLSDGEAVRIRMLRGDTVVDEMKVEG